MAQSFLSTAKFITQYSSERFLSICGEKIYQSHAKQMCDHMCDHTYKCVILVKSHIFFTLCHTSFLDSTKCDFNTF